MIVSPGGPDWSKPFISRCSVTSPKEFEVEYIPEFTGPQRSEVIGIAVLPGALAAVTHRARW
jgi:hypothetical protein